MTAPDFGGKGGQISVVAQPYIWPIVAKQMISKALPPSGYKILIAVSPSDATLDKSLKCGFSDRHAIQKKELWLLPDLLFM
ncbi:MAG TPA: hypothetical protein PLS00_00090 [Niabella sp.]|nr:hypothetical protein [Niabella sp.]HUN01223.1 hypothetical protein [Niabella sp.]